MGWDSIKEKGSKFLKIEAGKSVRVHFLGEPEEKVVHFVEGKYAACLEESCAFCAKGNEKIDRFSIQAFNMEKKMAQIMEGPIGTLMQIVTIRNAYNKDITGLDFIISRSTGSPVKYTVVNVPTQFKPEMLTAPEEVPF